ncbi:NAD(P)-binding protein [Cylindrobasidium torrendii FP15055 ss-10]|uniref:NAD(P)-binding protein n=1 Tax=Cylindrobasidium torrendii FP15055 ss-10 TaxID=1314674 RepID=A0A0D7B5N9_9AGAR|nr:NAD(P)-binding protein [Cylindrobasidium torrendii FP15055 ss-10]
MSSDSPRSVAVLGYGVLGKPVTHALVKEGAKVVVLSRSASKLALPSGVSGVTVSYADEAGVTKALKEHSVDIVFSTLNELEDAQVSVARAAKAAGTVKLYVPSEFGAPTNGNKIHPWVAKDAIAETISKEIGIPTVRIFTGLFIEFIPWLVESDAHPGKIAITGKGQTKFSTTSFFDIAAFSAHIIATLPYEQLENIIVRLEGQSVSIQDIARITGKEIVVVKASELGAAARANSGLVTTESSAALQVAIEAGGLSTGFDPTEPNASAEVVAQRAGSGNALWKDFVFKKVPAGLFDV